MLGGEGGDLLEFDVEFGQPAGRQAEIVLLQHEVSSGAKTA